MKKVLALLLLGSITAASAQVTVSGKIDQGVGRRVGSADREVMDGSLSGSRLTFRGTEVINPELSAIFGFEHRFVPDTGTEASPPNPPGTFWNGYSWVGLKHRLGTVTLGRHFNASYLLVQGQFDPFGNETVASLRGIGVMPAVATSKTANDIKYDYSRSGMNVGANIGEATGANKPYSIAANYTKGRWFMGLAYENPTNINDHLTTFGVKYNTGKVDLRASISDGKTSTNAPVRGYLLGTVITTAPNALIKAGWAQGRVAGTTTERIGLGYQYNLSKRTYLYADVGHQLKPSISHDTGYDIGIQHSF
jgi:predicted porin